MSFLDRVFAGNESMILFLQRAVGYSLTGSTVEQCLFLLYGAGANGKSTFLEIIRALLSDYAQQADFSTFLVKRNDGVRNDLARMRGIRFVSAVEGDSGRTFSESVLKQLTGGDRVATRFLFQEYFEFQPQLKLFLATNHLPAISGTDEAIWRRIKLIPFLVTIPENERDPNLRNRLLEELPEILRWAVAGCQMWQREGLNFPREVYEATQEYREETDNVGRFLTDCCIVNPRGRALLSSVSSAYTSWCVANCEDILPRREFNQELLRRGYRKVKSGEWFWEGITLGSAGASPQCRGNEE